MVDKLPKMVVHKTVLSIPSKYVRATIQLESDKAFKFKEIIENKEKPLFQVSGIGTTKCPAVYQTLKIFPIDTSPDTIQIEVMVSQYRDRAIKEIIDITTDWISNIANKEEFHILDIKLVIRKKVNGVTSLHELGDLI